MRRSNRPIRKPENDYEEDQSSSNDDFAEDDQVDNRGQDQDIFNEDLGGDYDNLYDDYNMQQPMEKHNDLLKRLTDFDKFCKDRANTWLGLVWNQETKKYERDKNMQPVMNKKGADWCIGVLKNYTRDNNIITTLDENEYTIIIGDVIDTIWYNIPVRKAEFGIRNNGDALRICNEIEHDIRLALTGAGGGKYNQLLTSTTNRHETVNLTPNMYNQNPQMNRRGFFDRVKSVFGGS